MMMNKLRPGALLILGLSLMVAGCATRKAKRTVTLEEVGVNAAQSVYRATPTRVWDITHTEVSLGFDWKEKTATGTAKLLLHPYFYATDSLWLDAKSMRIDSVALADKAGIRAVKYTYEDDVLKLKFEKAYTASEDIELYIRYKAMPYADEAGGSKAITESRGLYFINTNYKIPGKPAQIWTQGETQSNSHWMPTNDNPDERITVTLNLTIPDSFQTLGNGKLTGSKPLPGGMRTDTWHMDKPIQVYAVMFAIGRFAIVEEKDGSIPVNYYVEQEYAPYAKLIFNHTPEMIEYFSKISGVPYPWNKYSQVVVRDYVSGAMENTTASVFGEFVNQNAREIADKNYEFVVAHELFHQWFGDYVTAESWSNLTVNESFANYGEVLWQRYKYGKADADEYAIQQMWTYVYGQAQSSDPALVRFHYNDREDMFDRVSYQKGGAILGYIHGLVGDSAFYKAMNLYLTKNALESAEATHWRLALEEATGQDWNRFFNQWYYKGGHPTLDLSYDYDDARKELNVTVSQKQDKAYWLPMKAWVLYGNEKTIVDWDFDIKTQTFTYPYKNGIKPLVLADAEHYLVGEINHNLTPAQWREIYTHSNDNFVNKRFAVGAAFKKTEDSASIAIINMALGDKRHTIRKLALDNMLNGKADNYKGRWKERVTVLAKSDSSNAVRASAITLLGSWQAQDVADVLYLSLADSSYMVSGAALEALYGMKPQRDTAYSIATAMLNEHPKAAQRAAIWYILGDKGAASDADLYEREMWRFYGTEKIELASSISSYLQNVRDTAAFNKVLNVFVRLINAENIGSYRSGMASYLFEAAALIKRAADNDKRKEDRERMARKAEQMKIAADVVIAAEENENNLKQYKNYRKIIYGK